MKLKRFCIYVSLAIILLVGLLFTIVGAMFLYTYHIKNDDDNKCVDRRGHIFAHRGDTYLSQENTLEGGLSAVKQGLGTEFDIFILKTGELVLFHDKNALVTTGVDLQIEEATYSEFMNLEYKRELYGRSYEKKTKVVDLITYLNAICTENPNAHLLFDIKFVANKENMNKLLTIFSKSPCNCENTENVYEMSSPYAWYMNDIRESISSEQNRCKNIIKSYYMHPNSYPGGEYFWLKSRFFINIWKPQMISLYYKIWDEHRNVVQELIDDGFCLATYGKPQSYLEANFKNVTTYTVDVSDASVSNDDYIPSYSLWRGIFAIVILGPIITFMSMLLIILICCNFICKNEEKISKGGSDYIESNEKELNNVGNN